MTRAGWTSAWGRARAALCGGAWLIGLFMATGCAGSLADQVRDEPAGRFGPAAAVALVGVGTPPDAPQAPHIAGEPGSEERRADEVLVRGPVAAEDLAAAGVVVDAGVLRAVQAASWVPGDALDREQARVAFLGRSPRVQAAVQRYRASYARYGQVEWLNDLVQQYDAFAQGMTSSVGMAGSMGGKPSWPLGGAGRMESAIADVDVQLGRARLEGQVLDALVAFEEAFQEALYWERAASVLARDLRLADQVVAAAEAMYSGGRGSYADVLLSRIRRDEVGELRRTAEERIAAQRLALGATLDLPPGALDGSKLRVGEALPPLPDRGAAREKAATTGPDVRMAAAMAERATLMVQLVERQLLPEISPGTAFGPMGEVPKRPGDVQYATKAPYLAELRLMRESEESSREQARRAGPAMADEQWVMLSDALRMHRLTAGSQRKRAAQALEAATDAYRSARASFVDVNAALLTVLDVELAAERLRKEAFVAAARLLAVVGTPAGPDEGEGDQKRGGEPAEPQGGTPSEPPGGAP